MDSKAQAQLSFDWVVPQASSPSFHSLQGVELELAMVWPQTSNFIPKQQDTLHLLCF